MTRASIVCASLYLNLSLTGCAGPVAVQPPRIVEVPVHVPQPAACKRLRALPLPAGSTAQDVIEAQQRVLLEYEAQVRECAQ